LLAICQICAPALADEPRTRILTLVESDSRLPLVQSLLRGIEAELGPGVTERGELFVEYLDLLRFSGPDQSGLMADFLAARHGDTDFDAVAVLGPNALAFLLDHRDAIAPDTPIVFGGLSAPGLAQSLPGNIPTDISGILSNFDILSTLDLAVTVLPDAPAIVVVAGSAPFDRQWRAVLSGLVGESFRDIPVTVLPENTADAMLAEVATLDPRTIVLYLSVNLDAAGQRFLPWQFAKALAEASPAPVWTVYESMLGTGVIGGQVENLDTTGRAIGTMLRDAVAGITPLPPTQTVGALPTVDWRAMRDHGLDHGLLPADTRLLFYEPTLWERYRGAIIAAAAVILAQAVTIAALIVNRRRLVQSQASLASERAQLIHVSRNLRLGQLSAALAHEINQPLAAIQANADAGARLVTRSPPDTTEIGAIFGDISGDVRRAAGIIANLRRLMVKGETAFDDVDLNDMVAATLALAGNELAARGAQVRQTLAPNAVHVRGNGPQLQQIVLNLTLNAAEAMADLPEPARIVQVATARLPDGSATLAVIDAGPGLPPDLREDVFRPFVTTKSTGLGVGLAICRSIAEAHGGTLAFTAPQAGQGARVLLTQPPPQDIAA
jgi:signal transduction histidine kinase